MSEQILDYSEMNSEFKKENTEDIDKIYSIASPNFSTEDFLEESLSKKIEICEEQIESCESEIAGREKIHRKQISELKDQKQDFMSALSNPLKLKRFAVGENLQEKKADVSEKIGNTEDKIREEERENWKDKEKLNDKIRDLKKEIEELKKRKNFMKAYANVI